MPTAKQLVVNALKRTGDAVVRDVARVPSARWEDFPAGCMSSLREVLQHLIECEDWWLENIGVPREERPVRPDLSAAASAADMAATFRDARKHLLRVVRALPDGFFDVRPPTCHYGSLNTGADLLHYAAEHTFYHDGQIQMLEMAFTAG